MRSVAVVFPASICAMIPMFRQRFRGTWRATVSSLSTSRQPLASVKTYGYLFLLQNFFGLLPAIVRECLVGLGHAVNVFLLLHRGAAAVRCIQQLVGQLVDHALFPAGAAIGHQPADGE